MISIVIPAHNEEAVILRNLRAMTRGAEPGELEIIVVCNGCTDGTAAVARTAGSPVRVIEIATASKAAALNVGDRAARGFPRFYVDADVVLDLPAIRLMAAVLENTSLLMVSPELSMDLGETTWPVRAFYRVWTRMPYNRDHGMVGTGVYALSERGRRRFAIFPNLIADDGYVRFSFAPEERGYVRGAVSRVDPPATLWNLIRIKTRARLGGYQLRKALPNMRNTEKKSWTATLAVVLSEPTIWPCLPVYAAVNMITRYRAARQLKSKTGLVWERDASARSAPVPTLRAGLGPQTLLNRSADRPGD